MIVDGRANLWLLRSNLAGDARFACVREFAQPERAPSNSGVAQQAVPMRRFQGSADCEVGSTVRTNSGCDLTRCHPEQLAPPDCPPDRSRKEIANAPTCVRRFRLEVPAPAV